MRKEIIKCDKCGVILDRDTKKEDEAGGYWEISYQNLPGWACFFYPHPNGVYSPFTICDKCFTKYINLKKPKEL
jgi:hypothetical protein